jgi:carboxyl-terminal processing protease
MFLATGLFTTGLVAGAAFPSLLSGGDSGFTTIISPPETVVPPPEDAPTSPGTEDLNELFVPFWEAWEIVHEDYVDQPVDDELLMQGAISGMLESLGDPHSSYMDPDQYKQANTRLEGEYEGIGVWVDATLEYLTVISTMPDTPAEEAGLQPGDEVIAVDGEDMTGVEGNLVIRRILGPAGTKVHLTIRREGVAEPLEFELTRERITIPSIESEMLDSGIAYLKIYDFGSDTTSDLRTALRSLMREDPEGLILDLRNNPGGLLNTAVDVTSEFLDGGVVLIERFGDGEEQIHRAEQGGLATEIPLVVLVNAGSASASEIVAAAIQDAKRGLLVGETTFGKGSVQNWTALSNDAGAVRVTIARWFSPADRQISELGLEPDVEVLIPEEGLEQGEDPQLDRAIELLQDMQ